EVPGGDAQAEGGVRHLRDHDAGGVARVALAVRPVVVPQPGEAAPTRRPVGDAREGAHRVEGTEVGSEPGVRGVVGEVGELVVEARTRPLEAGELIATREGGGERAAADRSV